MPTPALAAAFTLAGERAAEAEGLRRLTPDVVEALIDAGAFRIWVPKRYGGLEGDVHDLLDAIEGAAFHDGATGWCIMIANTTALNAAFLPPEHAERIYGDRRAVTGGFGMPAGVGTPVDGGIEVSGEWAWGSGSSHCTAFGGGVRIEGRPGAPFVYFDIDDVEFLDTWHVAGLKATASTDYRVTKAFVPEGRWVDFVSKPEPVVDSPLYRFSFFGGLALGTAGVTVGLAQRALSELITLADKRPAGSSKGLADRPVVQAELARAEAEIRSARAFMRQTVDDCWDAAVENGTMTDEHRRSLRLAAAHAAESCVRAVDRCYHSAGGIAVYSSSPIQRVFRDAHVASQHAMIAPRMMEPLGRMKFGLATDTAQF